MSSTGGQDINDPRTIAGLMREALFQSRCIKASIGDFTIIADIAELSEGAPQDKCASRSLILKVDNLERASRWAEEGSSVIFTGDFSKFIISWRGVLTRLNGKLFQCKFPDEIQIIDYRNCTRLDVGGRESLFSPVLVMTDSFHAEAYFALTNFSHAGLGGLLRVAESMPIRVGTRISGLVHCERGSVPVEGEIVQVKLNEEGSRVSGDILFQVGLRNISLEQPGPKKAEYSEAIERRQVPRVRVTI